MPRIKQGGGGKKGSFWVRPYEIADELIVSRNDETAPPQLRVQCQVRGDDAEEMDVVSLGVPLERGEAFDAIQPLIPGLQPSQVPEDETQLRLLLGTLTTEWRLAWVNRGYVQSFTAMPGTHRGTFHDMFLFNRASDGNRRVGISIRDTEGFESSWTMPWESPKDTAVRCTVGATPAEDEIEFFPSKSVWKTLIALGFDYDGFLKKLGKASALYTSIGLDGEVPGFFANHEDITPELIAHLHESGKKVVQWEVVDDKKYGIGPLRGDYAEVELKEVIVDDSAFQRELGYFMTGWDALVQTVTRDASARFMMGDTITPEGKQVASMVMLPVVNLYPDVVKLKKADGLPSIKLPPRSETWNLNGLVCMSVLAKRLLKEDALAEIVGNTDQLLAWANLKVPELQDDLLETGEEVEL